MNKAIKKYTGTYIALALLCIAAVLGSCKHDNLSIPKPNENIRPAADFIKNNYDFKLFYAALDYTGMITELNGQGPFTILALPDAAFNQEGIQSIEDIKKQNKDSLRRILQYHILKNRKLLSSDIPTNAVDVRYETLSGDQLYVSAVTSYSTWFFSGSMVIRPDVNLSNGVLHVMSKMMKYHKGSNVQSWLAANPRYSIFVAGLKKFGLWDALAQKGPYTIFAPVNSAFTDNGITAEDIAALSSGSYYGNRLFGSYIMYDRHFFISDKYVFKANGGEYTYELKLPNDTWTFRFGTDEGYTNPYSRMPYPQLQLLKPNIYGGLDVVGTYQPDYYGKPLPPIAGFDHLCENGLVHDIPGLLVKPAQATKL